MIRGGIFIKIEKNIYPYDPEAKKLPFYLAGIGGSGFQGRVSRPQGYLWHQIFFCGGGSGTLEYDNISVTVSAGDYFFIPKDHPHCYYPEAENWDIRWVAFDGCACDDTLEKLSMTRPAVISCYDDTAMEKLFDKMVSSQETDILYCGYICSGYVYEYMIRFHRYMNSEADSGKSRQMSMLLPVLRYMNENFRRDISMTELSDMLGITPQHFCRIFKKNTDKRPNEYLTELRLDEAKRLMSDSTVSVAEAAEKSGFRDAGYFSTVFRKHMGMPPSEYRRKNDS